METSLFMFEKSMNKSSIYNGIFLGILATGFGFNWITSNAIAAEIVSYHLDNYSLSVEMIGGFYQPGTCKPISIKIKNDKYFQSVSNLSVVLESGSDSKRFYADSNCTNKIPSMSITENSSIIEGENSFPGVKIYYAQDLNDKTDSVLRLMPQVKLKGQEPGNGKKFPVPTTIPLQEAAI